MKCSNSDHTVSATGREPFVNKLRNSLRERNGMVSNKKRRCVEDTQRERGERLSNSNTTTTAKSSIKQPIPAQPTPAQNQLQQQTLPHQSLIASSIRGSSSGDSASLSPVTNSKRQRAAKIARRESENETTASPSTATTPRISGPSAKQDNPDRRKRVQSSEDLPDDRELKMADKWPRGRRLPDPPCDDATQAPQPKHKNPDKNVPLDPGRCQLPIQHQHGNSSNSSNSNTTANSINRSSSRSSGNSSTSSNPSHSTSNSVKKTARRSRVQRLHLSGQKRLNKQPQPVGHVTTKPAVIRLSPTRSTSKSNIASMAASSSSTSSSSRDTPARGRREGRSNSNSSRDNRGTRKGANTLELNAGAENSDPGNSSPNITTNKKKNATGFDTVPARAQPIYVLHSTAEEQALKGSNKVMAPGLVSASKPSAAGSGKPSKFTASSDQAATNEQTTAEVSKVSNRETRRRRKKSNVKNHGLVSESSSISGHSRSSSVSSGAYTPGGSGAWTQSSKVMTISDAVALTSGQILQPTSSKEMEPHYSKNKVAKGRKKGQRLASGSGSNGSGSVSSRFTCLSTPTSNSRPTAFVAWGKSNTTPVANGIATSVRATTSSDQATFVSPPTVTDLHVSKTEKKTTHDLISPAPSSSSSTMSERSRSNSVLSNVSTSTSTSTPLATTQASDSTASADTILVPAPTLTATAAAAPLSKLSKKMQGLTSLSSASRRSRSGSLASITSTSTSASSMSCSSASSHTSANGVWNDLGMLSLADVKASGAPRNIVDQLRCFSAIETKNGQQARRSCLRQLHDITQTWMRDLQETKKKKKNGATRSTSHMDTNHDDVPASAELLVFGSCLLGVHSPSSDIDIVCLVPACVQRSDVFTSFVKVLHEADKVSNVCAIQEAFVPVVHFSLNGIQVDLVVARCEVDMLPRRDSGMVSNGYISNGSITDDTRCEDESGDVVMKTKKDFGSELCTLASQCDVKSIVSLNGWRVSKRLLELVPNRSSFRVLLCIVKAWARRRGIYSNIVGFLGGVNYAILCAKTCMDHPNHIHATLAQLLRSFFKTWSNWDWPTPVRLVPRVCTSPPTTHARSTPGTASGADAVSEHVDVEHEHELYSQYEVHSMHWDNTVLSYGKPQVMPILTPIFPAMNSAFNTSVGTLQIIKEEFRIANNVMQSILPPEIATAGKEESDGGSVGSAQLSSALEQLSASSCCCSTSNTSSIMSAVSVPISTSKSTLNFKSTAAEPAPFSLVQLVCPFEFFDEMTHVVRLTVFGRNKDQQRRWYGLVISRLRMLVNRLETVSQLQTVRPLPDPQPVLHASTPAAMAHGCTLYIGLHLMPGVSDSQVNLTPHVYRFKELLVRGWPGFETGMEFEWHFLRNSTLHSSSSSSSNGSGRENQGGNQQQKNSSSSGSNEYDSYIPPWIGDGTWTKLNDDERPKNVLTG